MEFDRHHIVLAALTALTRNGALDPSIWFVWSSLVRRIEKGTGWPVMREETGPGAE